jgi:hypothetical protein
MKNALRCIVMAVALSAGQAGAQTWVTVATFPYSLGSNRYVSYQIDAESIFKKGTFTFCKREDHRQGKR